MELSPKSLKGGNAMENKIELFDRYIDNELGADEKLTFESRLKTDREFALDFRVYLLSVREIMMEAKREDEAFGEAMMNLPEGEFMRVIKNTSRRHPEPEPRLCFAAFQMSENQFGTSHKSSNRRRSRIRERLAWISSVAAILVIGIFSLFFVHQSGMNKVDDMIFEANYVPDFSRGADSDAPPITIDNSPDWIPSDEDIKYFEREYYAVTASDIQAREDAGMRLAMVYLKVHDRDRAKAILTELSERFADDTEFAAQCCKILKQLD